MSSPFRYFRKHTKAFMAVAAVMCMFLFVFASGTGGGGRSQDNQRQSSAVVAAWDGGKITEGELASLVQQRLITDRFLQMTFVQAGGQYELPPNVPSLFLPSQDPSMVEMSTIQTELYASLATEAGMSVSTEMINRYIREIGLRRVGTDDVRGILANLGDGNLRANEAIVFNTLRKLLLAHFFSQSLADAGGVVLPEQRWEDWKRVNERISLQVATLPVESFLDQVPEPKEEELKTLFEQYRDAVPNRYASVGRRELPMAEPGFAVPRRVELQYLAGSVAERTEQLLASVTDEEIADYYERNKRFDYVKEDDPLSGLDFDNDMPFDPTADPPADEPPAEESTADDAGEPAEGEDASEELNPDAPAADETPAEASDEAATPAEEAADDVPTGEAASEEPAAEPSADATAPSEEPAAEATDAEGAGVEEPAAEEAAPGDGEQSSRARRSPFRLVALQAQEGEEEAVESGETELEGEGSEEASDAAADGATDDADEAAGDASASAEKPADDDAAAESADADDAETEAPVEYIPLEDVRDEIRRKLAREKAVEQLQRTIGEAAAKLQSEYNQYGRRVVEARSLEKEVPAAPARLKDLSWLAEESGLKLEKPEPLTARELLETPVGKAVDQQGRINVTQAAFVTLELYEPYLAKELEGDWYLVSKTSDTPQRVPEFAEVRDQVAAAWKRIEAAKLAEKAAEELAKEAATAPEGFEEFFKSKGYDVIPQTALFSWRTFPAGPGMGAPAELSEVPELKNVGPQFMETAFGLEAPEVKAVMNYDRSAAYVIRPHSRQYAPEALRKLFLAEDNTWLGRRDMLYEHQLDFQDMVNRRLQEQIANFKFDEEWEQRRAERMAERN